jgi:hypothetical protein
VGAVEKNCVNARSRINGMFANRIPHPFAKNADNSYIAVLRAFEDFVRG